MGRDGDGTWRLLVPFPSCCIHRQVSWPVEWRQQLAASQHQKHKCIWIPILKALDVASLCSKPISPYKHPGC